MIQAGLIAGDAGIDFVSPALLACLLTNSGSARNGRAMDTISASPRAKTVSATSGVLIRLEVMTGIDNSARTLALAQVKAARGTLVAMVGMRASCQADAGIDNGCASGFDGFAKLNDFVETAARFDQVQHR